MNCAVEPDPSECITGTIGSYTFGLDSVPLDSVRVDNNSLNRDLFIIGSTAAGAPVNGANPYALRAFLEDDTHTLFNGDSLPQSFLPAALFTQGSLELDLIDTSGVDPVYYYVSAAVDIPAKTPVPPALPLFVSALGGLGWIGWKRHRLQAV